MSLYGRGALHFGLLFLILLFWSDPSVLCWNQKHATHWSARAHDFMLDFMKACANSHCSILRSWIFTVDVDVWLWSKIIAMKYKRGWQNACQLLERNNADSNENLDLNAFQWGQWAVMWKATSESSWWQSPYSLLPLVSSGGCQTLAWDGGHI